VVAWLAERTVRRPALVGPTLSLLLEMLPDSCVPATLAQTYAALADRAREAHAHAEAEAMAEAEAEAEGKAEGAAASAADRAPAPSSSSSSSSRSGGSLSSGAAVGGGLAAAVAQLDRAGAMDADDRAPSLSRRQRAAHVQVRLSI